MNEKEILCDKIMAMFLLAVFGDSVGLTAEKLTKKEIKERFGFIRKIIPVRQDHEFCKDFELGQYSDDTQMLLAIARAYVKVKNFSLPDVYLEHIVEMEKNSAGWGEGTIKSLKNIQKVFPGDMFIKCDITDFGNPEGAGNGVAIKIAPVGAVMMANFLKIQKLNINDFESNWKGRERYLFECIARITMMTHRTRMAIASGFAQASAVAVCLGLYKSNNKSFRQALINTVTDAIQKGERYPLTGGLTDKLSERYQRLFQDDAYIKMSVDELLVATDGATCYVYNSLPFSHAMFLRNPTSIETLFEVINAGGDTDSNGAMVGALLGAYNGTKIIPKYFLDGLWKREEVESVAKQFCDTLGL